VATGLLTAAYSLHLAATAVWIGGLIFLSLVLPGQLARLPVEQRQSLIDSAVRRFLPVAWLCFAVFVGTGLMQMASSPNYEGLLAVGNTWAAAILTKHIVIGAMVALLAYQTWILRPRIERYALGLEKLDPNTIAVLRRRDLLLLRISVVLASVVLILTAVARANA
jgi:putative copper export protein